MRCFPRFLLLVPLGIALLRPNLAYPQGRERLALTITYEDTSRMNDGEDFNVRETELRTGLPPLWRDETRMVSLGVRWTVYDVKANDTAFEDFTAHSLRFPIRAAVTRGNHWSYATILTPAIRSDFDGLTSDDLGFNALALASYPWGPDWKISAGLAYGQNFGKSRFFPALGAMGSLGPRWQIELMFPRPRVSYTASSNIKVNATLEPGGDEWNVNLNGRSGDLALKEYRAGLEIEWRLTRDLFLISQAGCVFSRDLEFRDASDRDEERSIGNNWFFRAGLVYR